MRTWKAIGENGRSICTVTVVQNDGESDAAFLKRARANVDTQLARPGRRGFHASWVRGGRRIVTAE